MEFKPIKTAFVFFILLLFNFITASSAVTYDYRKAGVLDKIEFDGELYNDDRMFVLYIGKCTLDVKDNIIITTVYHEETPATHKWCLVTYRNVARYMPSRVDHFNSKKEAKAYMEKIEPRTPLISLRGNSPRVPLPYDQFVKWKKKNGFVEYDYKKMYQLGGTNPTERIYSKRY